MVISERSSHFFIVVQKRLSHLLRRCHDQFCRFRKICCRLDRKSGVLQKLLAQIDICTFKTHDKWHRQTDCLDCVDNTLSNDVTTHDTPEDIDKNGFHVLVCDQDLKGFRHLLLAGAPAYIEKICRLATGILNDVHRRHGKPGAIYQTSDIPLQSDIVQTEPRRFDLSRIFLVNVPHFQDILVPEESVVVEVEFGIQRIDNALWGHHKGIYFHKRAIERNKEFEDIAE